MNKSLLLQVDQKLGVSQLLLMSTLSNFTLSKRQEMLDKSLIAEPLKETLFGFLTCGRGGISSS
jgi:hypothetical protein